MIEKFSYVVLLAALYGGSHLCGRRASRIPDLALGTLFTIAFAKTNCDNGNRTE